MQTISIFTILFENPFWVGIYEYHADNKVEVSKITFGPEPKDVEVYELLLHEFQRFKFSMPIVDDRQAIIQKINPKRQQRQINKQLSEKTIGTKAQQALKLQYEESKELKKKRNRIREEEEKQRKFELKQIKKKEKHKGR